MKKLFLTAFLLLAISAGIRAQMTFTMASFPIVNDSIPYAKADTTSFNPGGSGSGVTWDFTSLIYFDSTLTTYKVPTSMPDGATFTSADVGLSDGGNNNYEFFDVLADSTVMVGEKTRVNSLVTYSNPAKVFTYPFNYNSSFADSFSGSYLFSGFPCNRYALVTVTYDGSGTLITTSGTYNNVSRIHRLWSIYDTTNLAGNAIQGYTTFNEYEWYISAQRAPVVKMTSDHFIISTNGTPAAPQETKEIFIQYSPPVSISDLKLLAEAPVAFPNPSQGEFSLKISLKSNSETNVEIVDLSGKVLGSVDGGILPAGENEIRINAKGLSAGMYFALIRAGAENYPVKIHIQ